MNLKFWLASRFLIFHSGAAGQSRSSDSDPESREDSRSFVRRMGLPAILSILGLSIGVASLTVAMAVVSGFEATLRGALIDVFGDILVMKRGEVVPALDETTQKLEKILPDITGVTPFLTLEGIVVGKGRLNGVVLQGVDPKSVHSVLRLRERVVEGEFNLAEPGRTAEGVMTVPALVGKALARRFSLTLGDQFKVVLPRVSALDSTAFTSKVIELHVVGVIDFGKADYDERTVIVSLRDARKMAEIKAPFAGVRLKLEDSNKAQVDSLELVRGLGPDWWVMDWTEGNRNFFRAIRYDRAAIFFVILIMVIAASFNVASNIYIGVLKRTSDIAILRALGMSQKDIAAIFRYQGMLFGVIGTAVGLLGGVMLAFLFLWVQTAFNFLPADVYKLNRIGVEFNLGDVTVVVFVAITICLLASLKPARRAALLDPVEGLRHE